MINRQLTDQRILVTRAVNKQENLTKLLARYGAVPVSLPSIEIEPLVEDSLEYGLVKQQILDLELYDVVICVSANAARLAGEVIDQYWPQLPLKVTWLAIGAASGQQLSYYDIDAQVMALGADSQSLLNHPQLQDVAGKKILILQGDSGRQLLSDTLRSRSAQVVQAVWYNRKLPIYTDDEIKNSLYNSTLSAILITSGQALCNLTTIAQGSLKQFEVGALLTTLLVVPSTRVAEIAATQGYQNIKVAKAADDESMLQALLTVRGLEANNEEKK